MHPACVFEAHAGCFYTFSKAPCGWPGILGMHGEEPPVWGSVVHAWLHTVKHTKTLNFDINLRVLSGFCGAAGINPGGVLWV